MGVHTMRLTLPVKGALTLLSAVVVASLVSVFGPAAIVGAAVGVVVGAVALLARRAWREWPRLTPEQQDRRRAMREELRRIRAQQ